MKVIIAGSRHLTDFNPLLDALLACPFVKEITEVVVGGAAGVDTVAADWAREEGIPVKTFEAKWFLYGRAAGPLRNDEMANYADALIAVPTHGSKGTLDMIRKAKKKGLKVFVHEWKP